MIITQDALQSTPNNFVIAEEGLLEQTNGDTVFWAGRAATLIYYTYHLAKQLRSEIEKPEVIVPSVMCATAANTALMAGLTPRFADINVNTGLVNLETIKARKTNNTVAVVVIHLLGNTVDIDPIAEWCHKNSILLIEDPTQALGATYPDGRSVGSIGDVSVYSFNRTKIIGAGNGALISQTPILTKQLHTILSEASPINVDNSRNLQLALSYRNLHHSLVGLLRLDKDNTQTISESFMNIRERYAPLYLRPVDATVNLNKAWENLSDSLKHRLKLAHIYADRLADMPWTLLTGFRESGVCWRFSLLLDNVDKQVEFSEAVRKDGFHVSNLYWAVNQFFNPDDVCEGADQFARRVVNLWVDNSVDEDYVQRCCDSLLQHAEML